MKTKLIYCLMLFGVALQLSALPPLPGWLGLLIIGMTQAPELERLDEVLSAQMRRAPVPEVKKQSVFKQKNLK